MILHNFLSGLLIGLGFIIPGVSGSVIATILGLYDKIITKVLNFTKDTKNNLIFLLPIILGILSSVLLFSKIILYLINNKLDFISYVSHNSFFNGSSFWYLFIFFRKKYS